MSGWSDFLFAYLLGGITFLPLVLVAVFVHGYLTLPQYGDVGGSAGGSANVDNDDIVLPGDDKIALEAAKRDEPKTARANPAFEDAAGYFAVCREYTPMGINAKPIERATPVGSTTVAAPSPSVYQTMYRSIFERKSAANSQTENNSVSQRPKNAGNVFYVVLRHGHLMLFDDEQQIEVRHVISLAHHDISVYSGGDVTPEGELFIKRNALCLSRKSTGSDQQTPDSQLSKPFYLFSENCSAKEDFYFALLRSQEQTFPSATDLPPKPKQFDVKHIISLVQKIHSSEDNVHSRWVNAVLGRVFLGIYKTTDLEHFIRDKLMTKISRVKRPSFLTNINIKGIDTGEAAPYFSNLRLKDLNVEGDCVVAADVRYSGNFRIEVAATVKIDLGQRFKAREVNLVLAVVLKRIEGHILFKIKPPPSNRIWLSFQTMPRMEMTIEPIVSSRQITYTVILRQIENRIKEIVAETLVQPFWDDIPFFRTEHKNWRGGIFDGDDKVDSGSSKSPRSTDDIQTEERSTDKTDQLPPMEKSYSFPVMDSPSANNVGLGLKQEDFKSMHDVSVPSSAENLVLKESADGTAEAVPAAAHLHLEEPQILEATHDAPDTDEVSESTAPGVQSPSPFSKPDSSPNPFAPSKPDTSSSSSSAHEPDLTRGEGADDVPPLNLGRRNTTSSRESVGSGDGASIASSSRESIKNIGGSLGRSFFMRRENTAASTATNPDDATTPTQKNTTLAAVSQAAVQARNWGWNAIQRQREARKNAESSNQPVDLTQPMGRGQPLPPPGTPLPGPINGKPGIGPYRTPKRKPVPSSPSLSAQQPNPDDPSTSVTPALPRRRRRGASHDTQEEEGGEMLVIAAPDEEDPETPATDEPQHTAWLSHEPEALHPVKENNTTLRPSSSASSRPTSSHSLSRKVHSPQPAVASYDDNDDFSGWMDDADDEPPTPVSKGATASSSTSASPLTKPIQSSA